MQAFSSRDCALCFKCSLSWVYLASLIVEKRSTLWLIRLLLVTVNGLESSCFFFSLESFQPGDMSPFLFMFSSANHWVREQNVIKQRGLRRSNWEGLAALATAETLTVDVSWLSWLALAYGWVICFIQLSSALKLIEKILRSYHNTLHDFLIHFCLSSLFNYVNTVNKLTFLLGPDIIILPQMKTGRCWGHLRTQWCFCN